MKLIIEDDDGRRTVVPFTQGQISIGREPGNVVRLSERNVSRHHALMMRDRDAVIVEDLGSSNGVRVNGDLIQGRTRIRNGDHIRIGDYNLALDDESKPEVADRPTQPDLSALPDTVVAAAPDRGSPFAGLAAVARFKKAAAIQAVLAKADAAGAKPPGPAAAETWPPDFHFVAPGTVDEMKAAETKRRRVILGAIAGSGLLFAGILAFGLLGRVAPAGGHGDSSGRGSAESLPVDGKGISSVDTQSTHAGTQAAPPEPVDSAVAPAPVPAASPAVAAPPLAPRPALATLKRARSSVDQVAFRKALNLYQDAVADVANGDYPSALSKLQASAELDPSSPDIQKELAICYSHLRQPAKGAAHYEQYLKLRPDAPDAADVRKMLSDYHASRSGE